MTAENDPASSGWHFDRRIPIALIVTILAQGAATIWWGATINARVGALEDRLTGAADQPGRIVRVETRLEDVQRSVDRIELKLDRMIRREPQP